MDTSKTLLESNCNPDPETKLKNHQAGDEIREDNKDPNVRKLSEGVYHYIDYYHIDKTDKNIAVGTMYGLEKLRTFVQMIDDYNKTPGIKEDKKVDAVRLYPVRTYDTKYKRTIDSIILVPTMVNDCDLKTVYNPSLTAQPYILGEGTPCPNLCKVSFFNPCDPE